RRRVSMSAIGSVIVTFVATFLASLETSRRGENRPSWFEVNACLVLPTALCDAGELAGVRHLPHADAAEPEHAVDGARPSAPRASGVAANAELGFASGLGDHRLGCHRQLSLNGKPRARSNARPSSSVLAVVTTVMS